MEKEKESEVLKSDLITETERVREAKYQFDLDTERFNTFKKEQHKSIQEASENLKRVRVQREALDGELAQLREQIRQTEDAANALERQHIEPMKLHRKFLHEVADAFDEIYKRRPLPHVPPMGQPIAAQDSKVTFFDSESGVQPSEPVEDGSTFIT